MSPFRNPRPAPVTCRTPLCELGVIPGSRWCQACWERLQKVKLELAVESANMHARGPSAAERRNTRRLKGPTCCVSDCWEPRGKGQQFCPAHRDIEQNEDSFA